jgi:hypothetical protein
LSESIKEACKDKNWLKAMNEELDQIERNQTLELVPRPKDKNVIGTKWIYKNKMYELASNQEQSHISMQRLCSG